MMLRTSRSSRLGLKGFAELPRARLYLLKQPCTFSIAITAWSAKVVTRSICFCANGFTVIARQRDHARWRRRPALEEHQGTFGTR